jgi:hypothetical protein
MRSTPGSRPGSTPSSGRTPSSFPVPPASLFPPDLPWNLLPISNLTTPYFSYPLNSLTPNSESEQRPRRAHLSAISRALSLSRPFPSPLPPCSPPFRRAYLHLPFPAETSLGLRSRSPFDLAPVWFASNLRCILPSDLPNVWGGEGKKLQHACADRGTSLLFHPSSRHTHFLVMIPTP